MTTVPPLSNADAILRRQAGHLGNAGTPANQDHDCTDACEFEISDLGRSLLAESNAASLSAAAGQVIETLNAESAARLKRAEEAEFAARLNAETLVAERAAWNAERSSLYAKNTRLEKTVATFDRDAERAMLCHFRTFRDEILVNVEGRGEVLLNRIIEPDLYAAVFSELLHGTRPHWHSDGLECVTPRAVTKAREEVARG